MAPTLVRARGPGGARLVRFGRQEEARRVARVLDVLGCPAEIVSHDERVALVRADVEGHGLAALFPRYDDVRVRAVFFSLLQVLERLWAAGHFLVALDPAGIRLGVTVGWAPPIHTDARWRAPEARASQAGDLYVLGHLLYLVLTGGVAFAGHGRENAPDPRDVRADAPDDLSALALDLLLLEPSERASAEEAYDVLAGATSDPYPEVVAWDDRLARGGLVVDPGLAARDLELRFDGRGAAIGPPLAQRVEAFGFVAPGQRAEMSALLRSTVRDPATVERLGRRLAAYAASAGIDVVWCTGEGDLDIVRALVRAPRAPLVVLLFDPPAEWLAARQAEHVEGVPPGDVQALPFVGGEGILATGDARATLEELRVLGAPTATGFSGRMQVAWKRVVSGILPRGRRDVARHRQLYRGGLRLLWVDAERAWHVALHLRASAVRSKDAAGQAESGVITGWFGESVNADAAPRTPLVRAVRHWREERPSRVEQVLGEALPLHGGSGVERVVGTLLLADAWIERGELREALRALRSLRVDARQHGWALVDQVARCLLVRTGHLEDVRDVEPVGTGLHALFACRGRADAAFASGDIDAGVQWLQRGSRLVQAWPGAPADEAGIRWARLAGKAPGGGGPAGAGWDALASVACARVAEDIPRVHTALEAAENRLTGASRPLLAMAVARFRGLMTGGARGGARVEGADKFFQAAGVPDIPRFQRVLVPELAFGVEALRRVPKPEDA